MLNNSKMAFLRASAVVLFVLTFLLSPAFAQSEQGELPTLAQIQRAYDGLRLDEAERMVREALQNSEAYTPPELIQLHLIMGYLAFQQNQVAVVRQNFESALSLQPDLALDSMLVSPRIVRLFEQVKNDFRVGLSTSPATVKYLVVEDRRLAALRRSLMLPGWGQRHLEHSTRGTIFTTSFIVALGASISLHLLQEQAQDHYLEATTPELARVRYDRYNQRYRLRNAALASAATIWGLSVIDILISPGASLQSPDKNETQRQMELGIKIQF